jgi:hypothetical protein
MLKRTAIYLLAFAVIIGVTLQAVGLALAAAGPPAMSMAAMDMGGDCDQPAPPCNGMTPYCMDSMSCFTNTAAPAAPLVVSVQLAWGAVSYFSINAAPVSLSIKPEHSPPILYA